MSQSHAPDAPDRLPGLIPCAAPANLRAYDLPHPRPFACSLHVDAQQISSVIDHVSNVQYVRWLDRAAELHADALGYTRRWMLQSQLMWFVARHEIDYLAEARLGDDLLIFTWVRDMRKVKSWRDYVVVRPADKAVIARAATLWVLVRLPDRRPMRIPSDMAARFDPLHLPDVQTA